MAEETTKIVRMQQRRGQKQDLPKPLRPGEIGFATDSRQMYIGADTTDPVSDIYNKTGIFEKTSSAQSTTSSLANSQMIKFTVPHKIYDKGEFDGVANVISWTPGTAVASTSVTSVGRQGTVFGDVGSGASFINNIREEAFTPTDLNVVKNGTSLVASSTASISSAEDFFFEQSSTDQNLSTHTHTLTFRTPPSGSEQISISYYSNSAIINSIESANVGLTNKQGFYTAKSIQSYRQLNNDNIRVADGIGIGFIGLQFKHIQVSTDVKHTPNAADFTNTLGTLYLTKKDTARESVAATIDAANATVTLVGNIVAGSYSIDSNSDFDVNGVYNHVYVKGGSGFFQDGKVLQMSEYETANAKIVATLPSNAASLTRTISQVSNNNGNVRITVENVENTQTVDSIRFIDTSGTDASGLDGQVFNIDSINSVSKTIDFTHPFNSAMDSDTANLSFITYKVADQSNVIVNSPRHGNLVNDSVNLVNDGAVNPQGVKAIGAVTDNTYVLTTSSNITANVANLTNTPVVANATVEATPVVSVDLSLATTPALVQTNVNGQGLWPKIASIPGTTDMMYVTHAEAVQKTPFTFALHEDAIGTVSALGLTPGEYNRPNATVKAKLEEWLNDIEDSQDVNIFKKVYVNSEFNSSAAGGTKLFTAWDLNLNSSIGEMTFEERTEARDFAKILNNLYFESVNPDIRGLMNIKSNIEFLTTEALSAGTATTTFTSPERLTIGTGSNQRANELDISFSGDGQVNTQFVEYSMSASTVSGQYRRVGTLTYSGDATINDIVLSDNYTDARSGTLTGNVEFSANVDSGTGVIYVSNTLDPATSIDVRYVVRRWPD